MTTDGDLPMQDDATGAEDEAKLDDDAKLDELEAGIGETRGGLTETVQAIGERLEPANLAREAGQTVRGATIGKVDQMTSGAQQTWDDIRSGRPEGIVDTIKSNPLPAGMVVAGIAMLLMKRGSQSNGGSQRYSQYGQGSDRYRYDSGYGATSYRPAYGSQQGFRSGSQQQGGSPADMIGERVSDVGDKVGQTVDDVKENVSRAASDFGEQGSQMARMRANQLQDAWDDNPVGFGIVALAAGAALGLLLPSTPVERQALGPTRDKVVETAEEKVHETLDKVQSQTGSNQPVGSSQGA